MTTGFIAWQGPSPVTGEPLVLVITGRSHNTKTGPMFQAWLLLRDVAPFEALKTGADAAICGSCVHRAPQRRTCYVSMFNGPVNIWRKLPEYPVLSVDAASRRLSGEHVRVTAYGDPAFVPFDVWDELLAEAEGWTGYTHQWRTCDPQFRSMLMASVETEAEAEEAHARGWRTFRARPAGAPTRADEFQCPASDEAGHRTTCLRCRLCRGTSSPAKHVTILLHGRSVGRQLGEPFAKYDEVRQELATAGYAVLPVSEPQSYRVRLALRQFYRRRQQLVDISAKRLRSGLYLFWLRQDAEGPRA